MNEMRYIKRRRREIWKKNVEREKKKERERERKKYTYWFNI
jgi:hypothetical protein